MRNDGASCTPSRRRLARKPGALVVSGMALALMGADPGPLEGQAVELRWGLEAGDDHRYRMTQEARTGMGAMGHVTQTQELTMRMEVLAADAGGTTDVRISYESVRHQQDGPMGSQSYDSDEDERPDQGELAVLAHLLDQTFELTMDSRGDVREVRGMDGFVDEMAEIIAQGAGEPHDPAQAREVLEGTFGDESMASLMQQGIQSLPEDPVEAGDSWTLDMAVPTPFGTVSSEYHYHLEEIETLDGRRLARISVEGNMEEFRVEAADGPMAQIAAMMEDSEGEMHGHLLFDPDRGLLVESVMESTLSMDAMGQQVDVETTQEMELITP